MILHIVSDDKFIDMAYNMFERVSFNNNKFILVGNKTSFKYIKTTPITQISRFRFLSKRFANSLNQYEFIVIHSLGDYAKQLVFNADRKIKFLWLGWGFDYYCYLDIELLFEKTKILKAKLSRNDSASKKFYKQIKNFLKYRILLNAKYDVNQMFNRIDFFAPVLFEDYLLLKKQYLGFSPTYLDWNYGTLEDDLTLNNLKISEKNILLGNSATYENNHIEAIDLVSQLNLVGRQVICPLSYGSKDYAKEIVKYAKQKIGDKFVSLLDFMDARKYNEIISSCSIVVMNHLRQQAVGNIVIMLFFGAKLFLNKQNTVYHFLKKLGAIIFEMSELNNENIFLELTETEKKINRAVVKKYLGRKIMIKKTKKLINLINNTDA